MASRSLSSGAHSRDPVARNDGGGSCRLSRQRLIEVLPAGIHRFDQSQFLRAATGLDLLFASDRLGHALVQFIPNQHLAAIFLRESIKQPLAVLEGAPRQVGRNAGVESPVTLVCHDVDARLFHLLFSLLCHRPETVIARSAATKQSTLFFPARQWIASLRSQ